MRIVQGNGGISVVITPGGGSGESHRASVLSLFVGRNIKTGFDNEILYQHKLLISSVSEKKRKKILVSSLPGEYNMWKSNLWRKELC
jgi:hypothetical protein